jgi:hypothetical protein
MSITVSFPSASQTDSDLLRAAEAGIRARQDADRAREAAEDALWGFAALAASQDPASPCLGPEDTMAFLDAQLARDDDDAAGQCHR